MHNTFLLKRSKRSEYNFTLHHHPSSLLPALHKQRPRLSPIIHKAIFPQVTLSHSIHTKRFSSHRRKKQINSLHHPLLPSKSTYITSAALSRTPNIPEEFQPPSEEFLSQHTIDTVYPNYYISSNPALWPTVPYVINHSTTTDRYLSQTLPEIPRVGSQQLTNNDKTLFQNISQHVVLNGGYVSDQIMVEEFDISPQKQLQPKALLEQRYSVRTMKQNWGLIATQDIESSSTIISIPHHLYMLPSNGLLVTKKTAIEMDQHRRKLMDYQNFSFIVDSLRLSLNALVDIIDEADGKSYINIASAKRNKYDENDKKPLDNDNDSLQLKNMKKRYSLDHSNDNNDSPFPFNPNELSDDAEHLQYDKLPPELKEMNEIINTKYQESAISHRKALEYVSFAFTLVANRIINVDSALYPQIQALPASFPANEIISDPTSHFSHIAQGRIPQHGQILNEVLDFLQTYTCGDYYDYYQKLQLDEKNENKLGKLGQEFSKHIKTPNSHNSTHFDISDDTENDNGMAPNALTDFFSTLPHNDAVLKAMNENRTRSLWEAFFSYSLYYNPQLEKQEVADMIRWAYFAISTRSFNNWNSSQAFFQPKFKISSYANDDETKFRQLLGLDDDPTEQNKKNGATSVNSVDPAIDIDYNTIIDVDKPGDIDYDHNNENLTPEHKLMIEKERKYLSRLFIDPDNGLYIPPIIEYINESNTPNCTLYPTSFDPHVTQHLTQSVQHIKSTSNILPSVNFFINTTEVLHSGHPIPSNIKIPSLKVVTNKPIKKGEQITISYNDLLEIKPLQPITPENEHKIEHILRTSNDMEKLFRTSLVRNPTAFDYFKNGTTFPALSNSSSPASYGYFPSLHFSDNMQLIRTPLNNTQFIMPSNLYLSTEWNKSIQQTNYEDYISEIGEVAPKTETELLTIASKYIQPEHLYEKGNNNINSGISKLLKKSTMQKYQHQEDPVLPLSIFSTSFYPEKRFSHYSGLFVDEQPRLKSLSDYYHPMYSEPMTSTPDSYPILSYDEAPIKFILPSTQNDFQPLLQQHTRYQHILEQFLNSSVMDEFSGNDIPFLQALKMGWLGPSIELEVFARLQAIGGISAPNPHNDDIKQHNIQTEDDAIDFLGQRIMTKIDSVLDFIDKKMRERYNLGPKNEDADELDIEYWFEGLTEPLDDETEYGKLIYHYLSFQHYTEYLNARSLPETIRSYDNFLKQREFDPAMASLYLYHHNSLSMHCTKVMATRLGLGLTPYVAPASNTIDNQHSNQILMKRARTTLTTQPIVPLWYDLDGLVAPHNMNQHMKVLKFPRKTHPYGSVEFF